MDLTTSPRAVADRARAIAPGFFTAALIAVAASFVSDTYGGPVMLLALLLGIAFHFLSKGPGTAAGVSFASKTVLRIGVALLGLRIALSDLTALGSETLIIVAVAVAATLGFGVLICRFFEQSRAFGVLIGGATGICGASAALALSGVLGDRLKERETAFAVVS
ncbi:MAG: putative sulfate exporter family transporter, partial [Pseudomonadota bacterium]